MRSTNMAGRSQLLALLGLALALARALGVRVILDPALEPSPQECHHIYRTIFSDDVLWDLANAGLLNQTDIPDHYVLPATEADGTKKLIKSDFKFNSSLNFEWMSKLEYIMPLDEVNALHLFDDAREVALAAGPQVDQQMCGLHLAYMRRMIQKHLNSFRDSSDRSIFRIMHSSDGPNYSIGRGNTIFLGNYQLCVDSKLSIVRDELARIDRSAADAFFSGRQRRSMEPSLVDSLAAALGPLIGYIAKPENELLARNQHKIQRLGMRYCMAAVRYPEWRNDSFSMRNENLRLAVCLPESCDSRSLEQHGHLIRQLVEFNMKPYYSDNFYLAQLYCLPDEQSELRNPLNFADVTLFIAFNVIWLWLVVLATGVFVYKAHLCGRGEAGEDWMQSRWWHYLSCWCLPRNYRQFMSFERTTVAEASQKVSNGYGKVQEQPSQMRFNKVNFEPMEGFKVVSAIGVIASHALMIAMSSNWNHIDGHKLLSRTFVASGPYIFPAVVDNFFVATGILTVGLLMRMPRAQLESKKFWPVFIIYRYLRIVPLYALVHWFLQTYFRFLGSGPRWDYGTSRTGWISMCRNESLWDVIIPRANFKSAANHCNHVGWYLANDIQFTFLVPILTFIYLKDYLTGQLVVVSSSLLVLANHIWYYLTVNADARAVFEPSMMVLVEVASEIWDGYVMPQYRCLAFLVGIAAGHLLNKYERDEIREWPRWFLVGGKILIALNAYILCMMPFLTQLMPLHNEQGVLIVGSLLQGSMHGLTSVAAALFILFLCTGHLPNIARLFSLNFLKPLASMALSTLLVHIPLLYYHSQSIDHLPKLSQYNLITATAIWCAESYAIALFVHLLYEMPLRKVLLKIMLGLLSDNKRPNDRRVSASDQMSNTMVLDDGGEKEQTTKDAELAIEAESIALTETGKSRRRGI